VKNNQGLPKAKIAVIAVMHHMQNTTKKLVSHMYHLTHNNYRSIELRHSFHQVGSIALTQASVNHQM